MHLNGFIEFYMYLYSWWIYNGQNLVTKKTELRKFIIQLVSYGNNHKKTYIGIVVFWDISLRYIRRYCRVHRPEQFYCRQLRLYLHLDGISNSAFYVRGKLNFPIFPLLLNTIIDDNLKTKNHTKKTHEYRNFDQNIVHLFR